MQLRGKSLFTFFPFSASPKIRVNPRNPWFEIRDQNFLLFFNFST